MTQQTQNSDPSTSDKEKLIKIMELYKTFMTHMKELGEEEKQIIHDAIKASDNKKIEEIRKKIGSL